MFKECWSAKEPKWQYTVLLVAGGGSKEHFPLIPLILMMLFCIVQFQFGKNIGIQYVNCAKAKSTREKGYDYFTLIWFNPQELLHGFCNSAPFFLKIVKFCRCWGCGGGIWPCLSASSMYSFMILFINCWCDRCGYRAALWTLWHSLRVCEGTNLALLKIMLNSWYTCEISTVVVISGLLNEGLWVYTHGKPRIMGYFVEWVTTNDKNSLWKAVLWSITGRVWWVMKEWRSALQSLNMLGCFERLNFDVVLVNNVLVSEVTSNFGVLVALKQWMTYPNVNRKGLIR